MWYQRCPKPLGALKLKKLNSVFCLLNFPKNCRQTFPQFVNDPIKKRGCTEFIFNSIVVTTHIVITFGQRHTDNVI